MVCFDDSANATIFIILYTISVVNKCDIVTVLYNSTIYAMPLTMMSGKSLSFTSTFLIVASLCNVSTFLILVYRMFLILFYYLHSFA